MTRILFPVCKRTDYTFTPEGGNYGDYELVRTGETTPFFVGRAYVMPDESVARVSLNKIMQETLVSNINMNNVNVWQNDTDAAMSFNIGDNEYYTWLDYAYRDETITSSSSLLNEPITPYFDPRMYSIVSAINYEDNNDHIDIADNDGTTIYSGTIGGGNAGIKHFIARGNVKTTYNGQMVTREVVNNDKYQYALYYLNANGGYDGFLVKGTGKRTDKWTGYTYMYNNVFDNTREMYEEGKYLNDIHPEYSLNSGWMRTESCQRMHHLLESTKVFLHDLANDKVFPVVITDTTCDYKTFDNNGHHLTAYAINVKECQSKIRR